MTAGRNRLLGRHKHTLDSKGRVSIPMDFRGIFSEQGVTQLVVTNSDNCLDLYTPEQWEELMEWVDSLPQFLEETEQFRQFYISAAQWVDIDKQGRILIPPTLREEADLNKEVMVTGEGELLKIWDKDRWSQVNEANKLNFRKTKNKLAEISSKNR